MRPRITLTMLVLALAAPGPAHADRWSARIAHSDLPSFSPWRPGPRVPVPAPLTVTVSASLRTVYATSETGIVAVIDADRCGARDASGCDGAGRHDELSARPRRSRSPSTRRPARAMSPTSK